MALGALPSTRPVSALQECARINLPAGGDKLAREAAMVGSRHRHLGAAETLGFKRFEDRLGVLLHVRSHKKRRARHKYTFQIGGETGRKQPVLDVPLLGPWVREVNMACAQTLAGEHQVDQRT